MKLPQPGEAVGPYVCVRLLASGGMGAVYEARRSDLPRSVALKILLAPDDPDLVARFHREAEACGRLDHPNLIRVHDSGVAGRACFLAMELVAGQSLQGHLDRGGPLPEETAMARIAAAAAGIAHAHSLGVLHRDLKPSNILWDEELGRVRVVDFGLTGRLSTADSLTATGEVLGTPGYLAPEQVGTQGGVTDARTDVYGLGATLFALVCGRPPFLGGGMAGLAEVATDSAPDLRSLRAEISPDLAAIVARCLQKDPTLRYPSAQALFDVLEGRGDVSPVTSARRRRNRLGLLLGGGVALALTTALGVGLSSPSGPSLETKVRDYRAWRGAALEGFAYGWGASTPELEARLAAWSQELKDDSGSNRVPTWAPAVREVRAQLRLLAARQGQDPGFPNEGSLPPTGPADYLAEAVLQLEAGKAREAKAALSQVSGPLAKGAGFRLTQEALRAHLEPEAFLAELRAQTGPARVMAERSFPVALRLVAPKASQADLVRWSRGAALAGAKPGAALREVLRETLPLRKQELESLELRELAPYLRDLCTPIRDAGLWPEQGFVDLCRAHLKKVSSTASEGASSLAVVRFEHEIFYRVDPTPCWDPPFPLLLHLAGSADPTARPIQARSLLRYGSYPGGYGLEGIESPASRAESPALRAFSTHSEKQSRLEGAYRWWEKHHGARGTPEIEACSAAQADLERLFASGPNDLHPGLVFKLFEALNAHWGSRPWQDPAPFLEEATRVSQLAWREFEWSLTWATHHPSEGVEDGGAEAADLMARPWLLNSHTEGDRHPTAFAHYARTLLKVREVLASQPEQERRTLSTVLAKVYGRIGRTLREQVSTERAVELLEGGRELMAGRNQTDAEFLLFWGALLIAYRKTGEIAKGEEVIEQLRLAERTRSHLLALPVAKILLLAGRGPDAIPCLNRAQAQLLGQTVRTKAPAHEQAVILASLENGLRKCKEQR